jgi:type II secretory ATPase GspE/PulE/Tfp pilus assembly ATPase PilB-like protein
MRGRVGIFELLRIGDKLRKLISSSPTTEEISKTAGDGFVSMRHDGIEKILAGMTTPEEVLRVTQGIEDD